MKRALWVVSLGLVMVMAACGGGSSNDDEETPEVPTSKVAKRVVVANEFSGALGLGRLEIINGDTDAHSGFTISLGGRRPSRIVTAGTTTVVLNTGATTSISFVNNTTESEAGRVDIAAVPEDVVLNSAGTTAYVSLRSSNGVFAFNTSTGASTFIPVVSPQRLVMNNAGSKVLVFSADSNSVTVINTADNTTQTVAGFDRPVFAVFQTDTSALVMNCGAQCGGSAASVRVLDLSAAAPSLGNSVAVSGATTGLLEGTTLYVAGTVGAAGKLDVVNVTNLTVSKTIDIAAGFHTLMVQQSGKLFVGARTCNNACLTIVNPSGTAGVVPAVEGEVTGLQAISGRSIVYAAQGGELVIYDAATDKLHTTQIDLVGNILDVRQI